jgi:hypothetical protein
VRRTLAIALLIAAAGAGCTIDKRTAAFRCDVDSDCESDRRCEEGFCTVGVRDLPDSAPGTPDAPVVPVFDASPPDAFNCPGECTGGCTDNVTCLIDCSAADSCATPIVCPPGLACVVTCTGAPSCQTTIDCSASLGCQVSCGAIGACSGAITCPPGERCNVDCALDNTCAGGVSCAASCACDVLCTGAGSCATEADCPSPESQCGQGQGCSSAAGPCDDC